MQYMANKTLETLNIPIENFIGEFLYGSQNYNLDYENSDIDTIILVTEAEQPKIECSTLVGKTKVFTIRYFINRLKQGDLECYEILYTKLRNINPIYEDIFDNFVKEFFNCVNTERIQRALCNKLNEHLSSVLWVLSNNEKVRYNKKRLYWAIRVCNQLERLNSGESFESSLKYRPLLNYDLLKIKTIPNYLSIKDFNNIFKYLNKVLYSQPRYSIKILEAEEISLTNFYINITQINLNCKGVS